MSGFQEEHYKNTLALGVSFSVWRLTMVDLHMTARGGEQWSIVVSVMQEHQTGSRSLHHLGDCPGGAVSCQQFSDTILLMTSAL